MAQGLISPVTRIGDVIFHSEAAKNVGGMESAAPANSITCTAACTHPRPFWHGVLTRALCALIPSDHQPYAGTLHRINEWDRQDV